MLGLIKLLYTSRMIFFITIMDSGPNYLLVGTFKKSVLVSKQLIGVLKLNLIAYLNFSLKAAMTPSFARPSTQCLWGT